MRTGPVAPGSPGGPFRPGEPAITQLQRLNGRKRHIFVLLQFQRTRTDVDNFLQACC